MRSDGMSDGNLREPQFEHYIPRDDYEHVRAWNCPCRPEAKAMPGFGGGIIHRVIRFNVPDAPPQAWIWECLDALPDDFA
jgi:hypothetical protein